MRKIKIILNCIAIILLLISLNLGNQASGVTSSTNGDSSISVSILDAYYANLDNGSIENDVFTQFTLEISHDSSCAYCVLYISLVLPSGNQFTYYYIVITKSTNSIGLLYFYNHATESGWYKVRIFGVLITRNQISSCLASYSFDPPGGTPGDDPHSVSLIWI